MKRKTTPGRTLITVAPTGAESNKQDVPNLPTSLEELIATARACEAAGAALVHVHIRDETHEPSLDLGRLRETVAALREQTNLIIQLSTGGSVHDPLEHRLRVLDAKPDSCSLTMGTVNFGNEVFMNPWPFIVELYGRTRDLGIIPEFELFDLGHVTALDRLLDRFGPPDGGRVHCDLVLGVPGGMPGTAEAVITAVQALPDAVTSWSATGVGRSTVAVALTTLAAGGHLRVGMEDTLTYEPGQRVRDNAQLVERAARMATIAQRPPMAPEEARLLLNIRNCHATV